MSMTTLGIDLAKTVFHVQGRDVAGRPVFQKRFSRAALVKFMANLPSCRVGLEVASGRATGQQGEKTTKLRRSGPDRR